MGCMQKNHLQKQAVWEEMILEEDMQFPNLIFYNSCWSLEACDEEAVKVSVLTKILLAQWKPFSMSILCVISEPW
jgi:hypothetical protein